MEVVERLAVHGELIPELTAPHPPVARQPAVLYGCAESAAAVRCSPSQILPERESVCETDRDGAPATVDVRGPG